MTITETNDDGESFANDPPWPDRYEIRRVDMHQALYEALSFLSRENRIEVFAALLPRLHDLHEANRGR